MKNLNTAFEWLLDEYEQASKASFRNHSVARSIRNDIPAIIREVIGENDRYLVKGSPGNGNWASVPWVAIFDRLITESAQTGYYIVYLVRKDTSAVYLSLNQGVTSIHNQYGTEARHVLRTRAADFGMKLGERTSGLIHGKISLSVDGAQSLGAAYEDGAICSVLYEKGMIPKAEDLEADLYRFMRLYQILASSEPSLYRQADAEEDEIELGDEDLRTLREHKRIERNRKLVAQVKRLHGYDCEVCGLNFEKEYGSIGREFIEVHHRTPLAKLKGQKITLDPRTDFAVLCANCHRMIHRREDVGMIKEFQMEYVARKRR